MSTTTERPSTTERVSREEWESRLMASGLSGRTKRVGLLFLDYADPEFTDGLDLSGVVNPVNLYHASKELGHSGRGRVQRARVALSRAGFGKFLHHGGPGYGNPSEWTFSLPTEESN